MNEVLGFFIGMCFSLFIFYILNLIESTVLNRRRKDAQCDEWGLPHVNCNVPMPKCKPPKPDVPKPNGSISKPVGPENITFKDGGWRW